MPGRACAEPEVEREGAVHAVFPAPRHPGQVEVLGDPSGKGV